MTNFMVTGNVSRAAKTREATTPSGAKTLVTDFFVAVNDDSGENELTTFYKVTLWGQKGANLAPYLVTGKEVDVTGIPGQEKPWIGEDGQLRAGAMTIRRAKVGLRGKKIVGKEEIFDGEDAEA